MSDTAALELELAEISKDVDIALTFQPPEEREPLVETDASQAFNPHRFSARHVARCLDTDADHGLSHGEAAARLARDGPNALRGSRGVSLWRIVLRQVANSLTAVLAASAAVSFVIHDILEGSVVVFVIALNIGVGLVQDYRAEQSIRSLYALATPECRVVRGGRCIGVKAECLVRGDVVSLALGNVVPADMRLVHATNLSVDEAHLTGESGAVEKWPDVVLPDKDLPLGDRTNLVFAGSAVLRGRATGIVVATAGDTQVGRISKLLLEKRSQSGGRGNTRCQRLLAACREGARGVLGLTGTPLQVQLSALALWLFGLATLLALIVFSASRWRLTKDVLLYGICVGVAVIPESLPAVLTITMAVATKAMARGHVIVRQMPSLEAAGGVTHVCSDKTGTITRGQMAVRRVWLRRKQYGLVVDEGRRVLWSSPPGMACVELFCDVAWFCNNAVVVEDEQQEEHQEHQEHREQQEDQDPMVDYVRIVGDPTEVALKEFVLATQKEEPPAYGLPLAEHPFDSSRKLMTVVFSYMGNTTFVVYTKGAPEAVVPKLSEGEELKDAIRRQTEEMAANGLRVLCLAFKMAHWVGDVEDRDAMECDLKFLGLVGLEDPPRPETAAAVAQCREAGIAVHMVTGDHATTAAAIAAQVGILPRHRGPSGRGAVMSADEFDRLSDAQVDALPALPLVLARCSPLTKVRLIEALHRRGAVCLMTGDGVNDSPALKRADVGVAMGLRGSDVAKEASDMVLADDNFASIVTSIREGRRLSDNIQRFLLHLLSTNLAQVILLLVGLAFKDSQRTSVFPLSPLEILWANLITSSMLALGLGMERAQGDVLTRPPRPPHSGVFTPALMRDQLVYGGSMGALCLGAFASVAYAASGGGLHALPEHCNAHGAARCGAVYRARAATFATLSLLILATALEVKHPRRSLFGADGRGPTATAVLRRVGDNEFLAWSVLGGLAATLPVIYVAGINTAVFEHEALTWEWAVVGGALVVHVGVMEGWKALKRLHPGL